MKRTTIVAMAVMLLAVSPLARADEWEQVTPPSTGGYSGGAAGGAGAAVSAGLAAPATATSDLQALNDTLDSVKSMQPSLDPCEIIGLLAAVAATARDQGQTKSQEVEEAICSFDRLVTGTHAPLQWSGPFEVLMDREIGFVYRHRR